MSVSTSVSKAKSVAVALSIATGMLASEASLFATAAKADPNRHRRYGYGQSYERPRHFEYRRYPEPRHDGRRHHRDRSGDAVAATVLGIGALMIGAAVADAARRNRHQHHDD